METIDSKNTAVGETPGLVNNAARWGAIVGLVAVVLGMVTYAVDYSFLANWKFGIMFLVIFLGAVIYAGISYRNSIGGYLSYGKAFQHGFIAMAVAGLLHVIFNVLLYTVIDPDLPQNLADISAENAAEMMKGFGMPEDKIDEQMDKMRGDMVNNFKPAGLLKGYAIGLIIYAVLSAISSLFVKRNPPETF